LVIKLQYSRNAPLKARAWLPESALLPIILRSIRDRGGRWPDRGPSTDLQLVTGIVLVGTPLSREEMKPIFCCTSEDHIHGKDMSTIKSDCAHHKGQGKYLLYNKLSHNYLSHNNLLHNGLLYNYLLYNNLLHNYFLYNHPLHNYLLYSNLLYNDLLYNYLLHNNPLHNHLLYNNSLHNYLLYNNLLYNDLLHNYLLQVVPTRVRHVETGTSIIERTKPCRKRQAGTAHYRDKLVL
jgi:hypothetical protein